jgi:hypothetical protein
MGDLNLQPQEVAGLWANVQDVIHPDYWNPSQWKPGNRIERSVHDAMRDCSINLICKFLTQLTVGPVAHRNISAAHRIKFLTDLTDRRATPVYPTASPNMPSSADHKRWEIRQLHYTRGYRSAASVMLIRRLSQPDHPAPQYSGEIPHVSSNMVSDSDHTADIAVNRTNDTSENNYQTADRIDNRTTEDHDRENRNMEPKKDPFEPILNITTESASGSIPTQDLRVGNEDLGSTDIAVNESFSETVFDSDAEEEHDIPVYRDPLTGRYYTSEHDPNDDPGMSIQLEIPGEEILVTPDMLERAKELCTEQEEADTLAVSAVLTHERAWDEITQRAISVGRLSPLAFATLARQYLSASNRHIDEHLLYWKH